MSIDNTPEPARNDVEEAEEVEVVAHSEDAELEACCIVNDTEPL